MLLNEARRQGSAILAPDINLSRDLYSLEGRAIRAPLIVIRDMGPTGVAKILEARDQESPFQELFDLARGNPA
ncbi:hypothetical protein DFAR_1310019 [Desulfarculales bacterium]